MTDQPPVATPQSGSPLSASQAGALLQTGWRPWTGWVLLAVIVEQFVLGPPADWVAINLLHASAIPKISMEGLCFLASLAGVLIVSRTVEKIRNAD